MFDVEIIHLGRYSDHDLSLSSQRPQIKRRYSQFAKFHKIICRMIPTHRSLSFPPKCFFKMSTDVATSRRILLGQYLIAVINSSITYDTPEQDFIFKFLGGYDHIINDITEGFPAVNDWCQETYPILPSLNSTDLTNNQQRAGVSLDGIESNANDSTRGTGSQQENHSAPTTSTLKEISSDLYWKTTGAPFAAVFLSACMIVISFMGHIIKS